jgi:hypothetical protein
MINVKSLHCIFEGCKKQPFFNYENEKKGLYCKKHKCDNMIDVKHQTCIYDNCKTRPIFNIQGSKKGLYCKKHKFDFMVDITHQPCIFKGCKTRPTFNYRDEKKRLYCVKHKLDNMIDVENQSCKSEWCDTIVSEKYDGYCLFCYINLFPDKQVSYNYKTKEYAVIEFIKSKFPDLSWVSDKIVFDGCSKRRPDLLLDLGYQVIIIEIDENQHIDYDCSCENKRIMEISQDLGHRSVVFIRFNPDDYKINNKKISSCWTINSKGLCVIKKTQNEEWSNRLNILKETINYWSIEQTNKTVEIIELFYDI